MCAASSRARSGGRSSGTCPSCRARPYRAASAGRSPRRASTGSARSAACACATARPTAPATYAVCGAMWRPARGLAQTLLIEHLLVANIEDERHAHQLDAALEALEVGNLAERRQVDVVAAAEEHEVEEQRRRLSSRARRARRSSAGTCSARAGASADRRTRSCRGSRRRPRRRTRTATRTAATAGASDSERSAVI